MPKTNKLIKQIKKGLIEVKEINAGKMKGVSIKEMINSK